MKVYERRNKSWTGREWCHDFRALGVVLILRHVFIGDLIKILKINIIDRYNNRWIFKMIKKIRLAKCRVDYAYTACIIL